VLWRLCLQSSSSLPGRWPSRTLAKLRLVRSEMVARIVRTVVHVNEDGTIISQGADSSVTDEGIGKDYSMCRGSVVRNYQLNRIAAKGITLYNG
jgi:hypothetical protein